MSSIKFVVPQDCYLNHKVIEMFGHPEMLYCDNCQQVFDIRKFPAYYPNN